MPSAPASTRFILDAEARASRKSLRQSLRATRRAKSQSAQKRAATSLALRLLKQPEIKTAKRIALYWPADGEIDPRRFARMARLRGKQIYLPQLEFFPAPHITFSLWQAHSRFRHNRYGIPEIVSSTSLSAFELDVLLMPLVGFDDRCNRLGMGGGFYDRTLQRKLRLSAIKPILIGIAHEEQRVPRLPQAHWDVPLQAVVSDKHIYRSTH